MLPLSSRLVRSFSNCYSRRLCRYPECLILNCLGGGLAVSLTLWLRDNLDKYPMPAAVVCLSPWLDLTLSHPSFVLNRPFDHLTGIIGDESTKRKQGQFLPYAKDDVLHHPYLSPVYAKRRKNDADVMPPILIQVGKCELFRDESLAFYTSVFPGCRIRVEVFEDMCHVFQLLAPVEMFGRYSFMKCGEFIDSVGAGTVERKCVEYIKGGRSIEDIEEHALVDPEKVIENGRKELMKLFGGNLRDMMPSVPMGVKIGSEDLTDVKSIVVRDREEILEF
jgi:hypothetical protein